jgi:uncharacterized protein YeaC (DUF1315 family)
MEKTYQLELTPDQWEKLVAATYLSGWMTTAHLEEDQTGPFDDLEQVILNQTAHYQMDHLCIKNPGSEVFDYTAEAAEKFDEMVDEYDDLTFWEELSTRLAERDVAGLKMSDEEKADKVMQLADRYDTEFEKNGLKNLMVKRKF